jgi:hypothetical protein
MLWGGEKRARNRRGSQTWCLTALFAISRPINVDEKSLTDGGSYRQSATVIATNSWPASAAWPKKPSSVPNVPFSALP